MRAQKPERTLFRSGAVRSPERTLFRSGAVRRKQAILYIRPLLRSLAACLPVSNGWLAAAKQPPRIVGCDRLPGSVCMTVCGSPRDWLARKKHAAAFCQFLHLFLKTFYEKNSFYSRYQYYPERFCTSLVKCFLNSTMACIVQMFQFGVFAPLFKNILRKK